ncbi:hypothetical protein F4778DRAFT_779322 [Xylariomycetidae sp. FL2044]|nr:hypothetical protein F4778DRAFT_779322 [Xylariomycetidae sp. FL2044]
MQKSLILILANAVFGAVAIPNFADRLMGRKVQAQAAVPAVAARADCSRLCNVGCYLKIVDEGCKGCPHCEYLG